MGELSVILGQTIEEAEASVRAALQEQGFGVLTEIDVARVLKEKLDVTRRPLKILGACNPVMANDALSRNIDVALVLPCNVVLDAVSDDRTIVSIADPMTIMPGAEFSDLVNEAKKTPVVRSQFPRQLTYQTGIGQTSSQILGKSFSDSVTPQ